MELLDVSEAILAEVRPLCSALPQRHARREAEVIDGADHGFAVPKSAAYHPAAADRATHACDRFAAADEAAEPASPGNRWSAYWLSL